MSLQDVGHKRDYAQGIYCAPWWVLLHSLSSIKTRSEKEKTHQPCATGETEWTISGQCTGNAEIPLTENGKKQSRGTGKMLAGLGKLIEPAKLARVFCSPRIRALTTLDLLLGEETKSRLEGEGRITITEDITEWDYGKYEGLTPGQINTRREEQGVGRWDIWTEGCEGGE